MWISSTVKRLWLMIGVVAIFIVLTVYLAIVPTVQGRPNSLANLETKFLSDSLLPSKALNQAAVSGGRSRGGSFSAPSAPRAPSLPRSAPSPRYDYQPAPYSRGPVVVPYPTYGPAPVYVGPSSGGGGDLVLVVIVLGFILLPMVLNYVQAGTRGGDRPAQSGTQNELLNNLVTVSRLQVALLAQARDLQRDLNRITLEGETSTSQGLARQLQETILALLRHPDYWTHARADSKSILGREKAAEYFEQLSLQERSKFSVETLANVGGQVQRQTMPASHNRDVAAYIVVTLLVGTADDRPLFGSIQSVTDLKAALQRLGSISPDYLLVYELLWTPQDESDSLSQDELLAHYPELVTL
jgi:uncharacterized membrane protein